MKKGSNIVSNFIWRLFERFGTQIISFVLSIILARILDPNVYGQVAIVLVLISILSVFIDSGFGNALIQKKEVDDIDYSSVFYFNIFICLILYAILFFFAPSIALFYHSSELTSIIRVLGLTIIISGVTNIQNSYVSRNLLYKKYFYCTLIGTSISAIVGIILALNGYGVWSLVFQNLSNNIINTIALWAIVKWRPKLKFSFSRLKVLFSYGWKLLISSLINTTWTKLRQLIIGREFSASELAFYNKGSHFPDITTSSVITSINSVIFPTMSKAQDSIESVKNIMRKSIKIGSYILWPMMIGLASCADNFVIVFLSEKWIPIVPFLRIFCISYAFYPIHTSNLSAINAIGRSDLFLKLEIIKKISDFIIIIISIRYGVFAMALWTIPSNFLSQIINSWPNSKLLNYKYIDQIKDLMPALLMSAVMGIAVYSINYLGFNSLLTLIVQVLFGILVYFVLSKLTKNDSYKYCKDVFLSYINRK